MIYLDTHVLVWLYLKDIGLLSKKVIKAIESSDIYVSPMTGLELEYLFEIQRIKEHGNVILDYLVERIGVQVCSTPFDKIIKTAMDLKWTRDPFDRIITAQAMVNDAKLITKDRNIQAHYKKAIW